MFDIELLHEILNKIVWSIDIILKRSEDINSFEDFLRDDTGLEKLDSICMQFINIGEALKEIDKITSKRLFQKYTEIDWKAAMGFRDIISHHYFDIDAEVVFATIKERLPSLRKTINKINADTTN